MEFNSFLFIGFFVMISILLALTNHKKLQQGTKLKRTLVLRHVLLLAASYIFYGCWNVYCVLLLFGVSLFAYAVVLLYEKSGSKRYIWVGVVAPLIVLGVFKYFNFFIDSFCKLFRLGAHDGIRILLPVGISFYTFQALSYVIDVYRRKVTAERDFVKVALYIAFFPQLVAGPIVKADDFIPQLYEDRNISFVRLRKGVQIFVFGLFKKIVIADNISVLVDAVYANPRAWSAVTLLIAVISYSIQIYCDFSGYSDMAIGCAHVLGYDLHKNFDLPYLSANIAEFWKRWHISLSTWLQEYVYIPLGGNRKGKGRTYLNNLITMLIGGLWHGADWTFVVWGGMHGVALVVHKAVCDRLGRGKEYTYSVMHRFVSTTGTFLFVSLCWVFFRADSFGQAWDVLRGIFTLQAGVTFVSVWSILGIGVTAAAYLAAVLRSIKRREALAGFYPVTELDTVLQLTFFFLMIGFTLGLAYTGNNPFVYFQF